MSLPDQNQPIAASLVCLGRPLCELYIPTTAEYFIPLMTRYMSSSVCARLFSIPVTGVIVLNLPYQQSHTRDASVSAYTPEREGALGHMIASSWPRASRFFDNNTMSESHVLDHAAALLFLEPKQYMLHYMQRTEDAFSESNSNIVPSHV